jgi:hypothetical protein
MFFHLVARLHPNTLVATVTADIRRAREQRRLLPLAQDGDGSAGNCRIERSAASGCA